MNNNSKFDDNFYRYVGWDESYDCVKTLFSQQTINFISSEITKYLQGVGPDNRPIIVPDKTIISVLNNIYDSYRPATKDIYGRYNIPQENNQTYFQDIISQTIEVIYNDVKNNIQLDNCNSTLNIFDSIYGDFNRQGLRAHSKIKTREKNTNHRGMVSFMNY